LSLSSSCCLTYMCTLTLTSQVGERSCLHTLPSACLLHLARLPACSTLPACHFLSASLLALPSHSCASPPPALPLLAHATSRHSIPPRTHAHALYKLLPKPQLALAPLACRLPSWQPVPRKGAASGGQGGHRVGPAQPCGCRWAGLAVGGWVGGWVGNVGVVMGVVHATCTVPARCHSIHRTLCRDACFCHTNTSMLTSPSLEKCLPCSQGPPPRCPAQPSQPKVCAPVRVGSAFVPATPGVHTGALGGRAVGFREPWWAGRSCSVGTADRLGQRAEPN